MPNIKQPLQSTIPLVNPDGTATEYFLRFLRDRQGDVVTIDTDLTAIANTANSAQSTANAALSAVGNLGIDNLTDVDTSTTPPTDGQALVWVDADSMWEPGDVASGGGGGTNGEVAIFREERASGTNGGGSVATTWTTRTLNTSHYNNITGASLSSNQITLPAGTYKVLAYVPLFRPAQCRARLYNVTDSTVTLLSMSQYGLTGVSGDAVEVIINGVFSIAASKTFRIEYYATSAKTVDGLGVASSVTTEVYSTIRIEKLDPTGSSGIAVFTDKRLASTDGGTFTSGADRIRPLNTAVYNSITGASLYSSTFTVTIASPGVCTWTAHGLAVDDPVMLSTTGALPTGLATNTVYWVATVPTANTFTLATTRGGAAINTSGTQSGTHTITVSRMVLPAGTYEIDASASAHQVETHQCNLYDRTGAATLLNGTSERSRATSSTDGSNHSFIRGVFTLGVTSHVELRHRCTSTISGSGMGVGSGLTWNTPVFAQVKLRKIA